MAARLITEADVTKAGAGGSIVVDADTRITPAALDRAHRLGIAVEWRSGPGRGLVVASDVDRLARGERLTVAKGTLVTPWALDRARARGVAIEVGVVQSRREIAEPRQEPLSPPASAASASAPCCGAASVAPVVPVAAGASDSPPLARVLSRSRADVLRDLFSPKRDDGAY